VAEIPTISIVDDDPWAREGVKELVLSLGYRAVAFSSALEFVESGGIAETTCLIADLQMPGLNGLELQDRLLAQGHHTPIIFITAFPEGNVRARALKAGAIGFLEKPFDDEALIECLDRAIRTARRDDGTAESAKS
jgi:FixJ family two-component response regulator